MSSINILDYKISCAQGDLKATLDAIKNAHIRRDARQIVTEQETMELPFFLLQERVDEKADAIYSAIKTVVEQILTSLDDEQRRSTAVLIGTSLVDLYLTDAIKASRRGDTYASEKYSIDSYAKRLSRRFGLNPFIMTINTACTSSANALMEASNLINSGVVEYAIVVGVEISSQMMSNGFSSMKLLSQNGTKPFDLNRDGLILGEGIAAMLVGKIASEWSLAGGFTNCLSKNITSVGSDGTEYAEVMQRALEDVGISPDEITALKAHATGTYANDIAEINAIANVFEPSIVFTALKPYIGHTLGACGVLELAIFMGAIDAGFIPKTVACENPINPEYLPLVENKACNEGVFMCNYFGFGGNNTSLIIKRVLP